MIRSCKRLATSENYARFNQEERMRWNFPRNTAYAQKGNENENNITSDPNNEPSQSLPGHFQSPESLFRHEHYPVV